MLSSFVESTRHWKRRIVNPRKKRLSFIFLWSNHGNRAIGSREITCKAAISRRKSSCCLGDSTLSCSITWKRVNDTKTWFELKSIDLWANDFKRGKICSSSALPYFQSAHAKWRRMACESHSCEVSFPQYTTQLVFVQQMAVIAAANMPLGRKDTGHRMRDDFHKGVRQKKKLVIVVTLQDA